MKKRLVFLFVLLSLGLFILFLFGGLRPVENEVVLVQQQDGLVEIPSVMEETAPLNSEELEQQRQFELLRQQLVNGGDYSVNIVFTREGRPWFTDVFDVQWTPFDDSDSGEVSITQLSSGQLVRGTILSTGYLYAQSDKEEYKGNVQLDGNGELIGLGEYTHKNSRGDELGEFKIPPGWEIN